MRLILVALLCLFVPELYAATYYFSSSSGDDSRTAAQAQNPATPWKTIAKLNSFFASLSPGDAVLLTGGRIPGGSHHFQVRVFRRPDYYWCLWLRGQTRDFRVSEYHQLGFYWKRFI